MAGAKLRVKQLVEAAINGNLVETPVKSFVYENHNLKNVCQGKSFSLLFLDSVIS